jgi:uncharacterized protein involved in cysteine biosynthesis
MTSVPFKTYTRLTFMQGLKVPFDGLKIFYKNKQIRRLVYTPVLLMLAVAGSSFYAFFHYMAKYYSSIEQPLFTRVEGELHQYLSADMLEMSMGTLHAALKTSVYVIGFVMVSFLIFIIANILCSVFWEIIAHQVQKMLGRIPTTETKFYSSVIQPMKRELMKEMIFLAMIVLSYLVVAIPFIGGMISLIVAPVVITIWFGFIVCDYTMSARSRSVRERLNFGKSNVMFLLGIGTYLAIPWLAYALYPFLVIGAASYIKD